MARKYRRWGHEQWTHLCSSRHTELSSIQLNVLRQKYYAQSRPVGPEMTQAACAGLQHRGGNHPGKTQQRSFSLARHPNPEKLNSHNAALKCFSKRPDWSTKFSYVRGLMTKRSISLQPVLNQRVLQKRCPAGVGCGRTSLKPRDQGQVTPAKVLLHWEQQGWLRATRIMCLKKQQ